MTEKYNSLLDPSRICYIFHWKGQILDERGVQIGYIKWRKANIDAREIWNMNNKKVGEISYKFWSVSPLLSFSVIDVDGRNIGIIKKKYWSFSPYYHYEDDMRHRIFIIKGNYGETNYSILEYKSKEIKVNVFKYHTLPPREKLLFKPLNLETHDFIIYVKDASIDRFLLLCFISVIDGRSLIDFS